MVWIPGASKPVHMTDIFVGSGSRFAVKAAVPSASSALPTSPQALATPKLTICLPTSAQFRVSSQSRLEGCLSRSLTDELTNPARLPQEKHVQGGQVSGCDLCPVRLLPSLLRSQRRRRQIGQLPQTRPAQAEAQDEEEGEDRGQVLLTRVGSQACVEHHLAKQRI